MGKRMLVGLALLAAGAGLVASAAGRERRHAGPFARGAWGDMTDFDPAALVVIRSAFGEVNVVSGDVSRIALRVRENTAPGNAVHARRAGDASRSALVLNVHPRSCVDVTVPRGTAVRIEAAKTLIDLTGLDGVDVVSAKGSIAMRDVAGAVRIRSAGETIDVGLSRDRETRSVDIDIARASFSLAVPASRGGRYRIQSARSTVSAPPSVEGGIPVRVRAARAQVAIRAA